MADPYIRQMAREALAQTARNPNQDFLQATPRNSILGFLSDLAASSYSPERTQQMQGIAQFMGAPAISQTLNRLSYGEPLTTGAGGIGGTTRIRPEALEAAMAVAPMVGPAARITKGLPVGMGIKPVNLSEGIFKPELTMKEMLRVRDIPTVQRVQRSMDLVGEKKFQEMVESQFKEYKPTNQSQEAMLVESVTLDILGRANRDSDLLRGLPGLKVEETFAGFATPEQYSAAKLQGSMDAERWPAAWQRAGAVTPEEILRGKGIVQPPPTQRDKDLYLLESRFSGYMDASKARQFLENDMLKATKKEKDLLRKYYDASGKFITREEVPVQQAMQEFEQGLTNFMATR